MRRQTLLWAVIIITACTCTNMALGQTVTNAIATGNWVDASTWDGGVPVWNDDGLGTQSDAVINGGYTVTINAGDNATAFRVPVGDNDNGETGTIIMNGGTLKTDKMLSLGGFLTGATGNGTGILYQYDGDIFVGANHPGRTYAQLVVGHKGAAHGEYYLSGGTVDIPDGLSISHVSADSSGIMVQTGGTVTIGQGASNTNQGYFNIGNSGTGSYSISAGSVTMYSTQPMYLGYSTTGNGTVDQTGGSIAATSLFVARSGTGDYDMSSGTLTVAEDTWIASRLASQGTLSLSGDASVAIDGDLNVCAAVADNDTTPSGATGTLNIVGEGVSLTVNGNLTATGYSVDALNSSIFNFTTGATSDVSTISVVGSADIDGAVFDIIESTPVAFGTVVDLVSTVSGISNFGTASIGPSAAGAWALQLGGTSNEILQAIKATGIPGDTNDDNIVNDYDAGIVATNWGSTIAGGASVGDFNGDGVVDGVDASIMAANWGDHNEAGEGTVPEPSMLILLTGCLLAFAVRRTR